MNDLYDGQLLASYQAMIASRESDLIEAELVNSGEANFLASSKGHEGGAILASLLQSDDYIHCHYRDKALMFARGMSYEMLFYSALNKAESHSQGRQMVSHMSAPELNILSIVGPIGNNALQAAGIAHVIRNHRSNPLVTCAIGDGTSQQGEVMEGIAEAKRSNLPVLFFIHNNNLAISTRTAGKTFFSLPDGEQPTTFYGTDITYLDGTCPLEQLAVLAKIIKSIRQTRDPQIVIFNVDRLDNHSNADDQKLYRSVQEINNSIIANDPIINTKIYLLQQGFTVAELDQLQQQTIKKVRLALELARQGTAPQSYFKAERPIMSVITEYRGDFKQIERYTMLEAMRAVFDYQLSVNPQVYLLGEDIEDPKGDVFGVTKGLSTKFPGRVVNSALSESTIVGVAAGMSLVGMQVVAFIQFADFLPLAYNQIFTELSTMYWRTNGGWQCPVIVFAACGGYRPGLGPWHSITNEATFAHIPGLDVYMPSNAADAAGMLNNAFSSKRPSLFLYPKKLLNNQNPLDCTSKDIAQQIIPLGTARICQSGTDITLLALGNTVSLSLEVASTLATAGIKTEVIDLRTIKPYDQNTILHSVEKTRHLIVSHEDNLTCGIAGDIIAYCCEHSKFPIKVARVTRADTYTPCNYKNQLEILPSYEKILTASAKLLELELSWSSDDSQDSNILIVEVIGASPSDESVLIINIPIKVGDKVIRGQTLVEVEASKSAGEIVSPHDGIITEILVGLEEQAMVGNPLVKIRLDEGVIVDKKIIKTAILKKNINLNHQQQYLNNKSESDKIHLVYLSTPHYKTGSRLVLNQELLLNFPLSNNYDIVKRTGIEQRYYLAAEESIIDLAAHAAKAALSEQNLQLSDINLIICATCTPEKQLSPSSACLILEKLYHHYGETLIPAYDINAACSGYLYALANAKDYLQIRPNARVLLLTAEALSPRVDRHDFSTAFLFGDGASATIISGANHLNNNSCVIKEIYLSAIAENGDILRIPAVGNDFIFLEGQKLFNLAVKTMTLALEKSCQLAQINIAQLDYVIPHQANQRISNAIERKLNMKKNSLYSNIVRFGNTSSSTIPIAMAEILDTRASGENIALCAFGGGFTTGSVILKKI